MENLRLLILRRLLPCRDAEPEDDVTPTPSVAGGSSQAWDSVLSSQDSASQEVLGEPPGATEDTTPPSSREEPGPAAEEPSGYKVVRKGTRVTGGVLRWAGMGAGDPLLSLTCPWLGLGVSRPAWLSWIGGPRGEPSRPVCTPGVWGLMGAGLGMLVVGCWMLMGAGGGVLRHGGLVVLVGAGLGCWWWDAGCDGCW